MTDNAAIRDKLSLSLADAALKGDIEAAKMALNLGADVHYNYDVALRNAAKQGRIEMLFLLTAAGADVHAVNDEALRAAVKNGREDAVKRLLDLGANPDANEGEALIIASTKGMAGIVDALLLKDADPHFSDDHALRQAAYNGHIDIVRALAENKADLFSMRGSAMTLAAGEKHAAVIEFLAQAMQTQREFFLEDLASSDSREFLRAPWRGTGEPALVRAVKMNLAEKAIARLKECGDGLTAAELSGLKDRNGRPLGAVAAEYGKLGAFFDIEIWRSSLDEAQTAWNAIPPATRKQGGVTDAEFEGIVSGFRQKQLKEKAGKVRLKF